MLFKNFSERKEAARRWGEARYRWFPFLGADATLSTSVPPWRLWVGSEHSRLVSHQEAETHGKQAALAMKGRMGVL